MAVPRIDGISDSNHFHGDGDVSRAVRTLFLLFHMTRFVTRPDNLIVPSRPRQIPRIQRPSLKDGEPAKRSARFVKK